MDISSVVNLVERGVRDGVFPGACFAIGNSQEIVTKAVGNLRYDAEAPAVKTSTLWDLASVTKVVGTTAVAMSMNEKGLLDLDQPVCEIIPSFAKPRIAVRNLLLHNSGLPASHPNPGEFSDPEELLEDIYRLDLAYEVGADCVYSDLGFIVLGAALSRVSGLGLAALCSAEVFKPLGMADTSFGPRRCEDCAPTELRGSLNSSWIVGEVHDPTAFALGGVAGHAGLFSTVGDLSKFMQWMLAAKGDSIFLRRGNSVSSRALGWDTPSEGSSAGRKLGPRSFGHTGFTGTSVWADPDRDLFAVLLTNRVHPTATNLAIKQFRPAFHDAVVEAASPYRG